MAEPFVIAIVATYHRSRELARLVEGLDRQTVPLRGLVGADNGREEETAEILKSRNPETEKEGMERVYVPMAENLGCGPGLVAAIQETKIRFGTRPTHFWILDDDVVVSPGILEKLLKVLEETGAGCVVPLLTNHAGELWGFPEPLDSRLRKVIRGIKTPLEARELLGDEPLDFCWATGACLLVTAEAVRKVGLPREDFWMLGEDLEFSMRVAAQCRGVFTPQVEVPHLPPEAGNKEQGETWGYLKFCSLLQNLTYLTFHSPHSAHMGSYLPGNYRRFFRDYGWKVLGVALGCFWAGAVLAQPAGREFGKRLRGQTLKG